MSSCLRAFGKRHVLRRGLTPVRCATALSCAGSKIAALTVQIPFELPTESNVSGASGLSGQPAQAVLKIVEDGSSTNELSVGVFASRVHFIQGRHELALDLIDGLSVGASVFHADGNPVGPGRPAPIGETLVVYGYGFGKPDRALRTGEVATEASPVPMHGSIQFSVLLPDRPSILDGTTYQAARYVS